MRALSLARSQNECAGLDLLENNRWTGAEPISPDFALTLHSVSQDKLAHPPGADPEKARGVGGGDHTKPSAIARVVMVTAP